MSINLCNCYVKFILKQVADAGKHIGGVVGVQKNVSFIAFASQSFCFSHSFPSRFLKLSVESRCRLLCVLTFTSANTPPAPGLGDPALKDASPPSPADVEHAVRLISSPSAPDDEAPTTVKLPPTVSPEATVSETSPPVPEPDEQTFCYPHQWPRQCSMSSYHSRLLRQHQFLREKRIQTMVAVPTPLSIVTDPTDPL